MDDVAFCCGKTWTRINFIAWRPCVFSPFVPAQWPYWSHWNEWGEFFDALLMSAWQQPYTFSCSVNSAIDVFFWNQYLHWFPLYVFLYLSQSVLLFSSLSVLKVSSHSEPSSQSLSLQQPAQPPPPPPPPSQPPYGLPVPESRDKQLCFSDFEDLSASFRSLYKCVFEQSFSQQGGCRPWFIFYVD